jgi:HEAT repeat protein
MAGSEPGGQVRSRHTVLVVALAALSAAGCEWPPRAQADKNRKLAEDFDRQSKAEAAAWKMKADAEFKARIEQPGSITVEESNALIAKLEAPDPQTRRDAAKALADAKGRRAVEPLMSALRAERDEATYLALVLALDTIHDVRAIDALAEALSAPGISDEARMETLYAINRFRAADRFIPQIRDFHASLKDPSVKERVADLLSHIDK